MPYVRRRRIRRSALRSRRTTRRVLPRKTSRRVGRSRPGPQKTLALRGKWENPCSLSRMVRFRYADSGFVLTTAVGGGYQTNLTWRGNSLYDPDESGAGVQPYGYDEMMGMFDRYRVYSSEIKLRFYINEATARRVTISLFPSSDVSPDYIDVSDLRQIPFSRQHMISSTEGITRGNYMRQYCSTKKVIPDMMTMDVDFMASYNANPVRMWYWHVIADTVETQEEITILCDVQITYYARIWKETTPILNES